MIVFHDGSNRTFAAYSGGKAWNDAAFTGPVPNGFEGLNNIDSINALFAEAASRKPSTVTNMEQNLGGLIASPDVTLYVLKGPHQFAGTMMLNACHITVGYDGWIWHLEVWKTAPKKGTLPWSIVSASKGASRYDTGDGYGIVRRK